LQSFRVKSSYAPVKEKEQVASPAPRAVWTRPDAYMGAMARKRSFRRRHKDRQRTEPERPRLLLSTVPFLALIGLLAVLAVAIMIIAFPATQPRQAPRQLAAKELGVADRGWFQEAEKEMHGRR
jgi:hypothetical protein